MIGLPTRGPAGSSGSKVLAAQAGAGAACSCLAQGLAGLALMHDAGWCRNGSGNGAWTSCITIRYPFYPKVF